MSPAVAAALAGEHAAVFAYGVIGPRLGGGLASAARAAEEAHRARRDAVLVALSAAGETPAPAEPAYALPFPVTDRAAALRLAVHVEERTAALWRAALPETAGADRRRALDSLTDCALRAARWRRAAGRRPGTTPFPGAPG
ncbi:MAG TPA: DUF4439 domain-containing protein [Pilimelia sp.]|nr:DUF4439 domain-containing protein [Pilimelia sp.]